ncbi:hypothetical protein PC118_g20004 [Phytophthora cactorum]|uniref:Uncharacterized protein n=1 Tax=Phytophthora cactorum TaxID=29920 RepID=A0A8T1F498_9STRA|nr:hypothetical protein PC118_g20004 [Phytophthora cactorum]
MRIDMDAGLWSTSGRASTWTAQNHSKTRDPTCPSYHLRYVGCDRGLLQKIPMSSRRRRSYRVGYLSPKNTRLHALHEKQERNGLRCRSDFAVALSSVIAPAEFENCSRY